MLFDTGTLTLIVLVYCFSSHTHDAGSLVLTALKQSNGIKCTLEIWHNHNQYSNIKQYHTFTFTKLFCLLLVSC